eukprot:GHRR01024794.1.p1 GENE.GHRR01024794.1~~GHRR01024794.1.p1  ORF type:complete len:455 (+),score=151.56 GHRR01024794.1:262-1626(+)
MMRPYKDCVTIYRRIYIVCCSDLCCCRPAVATAAAALHNTAMSVLSSNDAWASWLQHSLQKLRDNNLERMLRPLVPTGCTVQVGDEQCALIQWVALMLPTHTYLVMSCMTYLDQPWQRCGVHIACLAAASLALLLLCEPQALIFMEEHEAWLRGQQSPDSCPDLALDPGSRSPAMQQHLNRIVLFSVNDYLGLSTHPALKAAAANAAWQVGCGPRSSALVSGFTTEHRQLELELARLKGTEDALLFPTGFSANVAVVSVLASAADNSSAVGYASGDTATTIKQPKVVIFSDELNHASLIDGARLALRGGSDVALCVYRHNDLAHLEQLLHQAPATARKLVITDSLFSMDGDFADLQGLVALKRCWGFLLVVDEAHATLVCGTHGGGAAEMMGVHELDAYVGTLSKAAGALGGFVACSKDMRQLLLNRGRGVVYSTALPVPVVAAARAALRVSQR